jgi:urease accessory protein
MPTAITTIMDMIMTTDPALYRLLAWLSPSYPVGAFSYSHGIERAVDAGYVTDMASAGDWIETVLRLGGGRTDAILFVAAHAAASRGDDVALGEAAETGAAFVATAELALESHAQGAAFLMATEAAWPVERAGAALDRLRGAWNGPVAYPVAVAVAAAAHEIPLQPALVAYLHAFAANLVSAAVRLIPLGQTEGQKLVTFLEITVLETAAEALASDLEALAGAVPMSDICSMTHETQYTRLFRS